MRKSSIFAMMAILLASVTSCEKDNYDAPDSSIFGSFIDEETGQLVEQDIYNGTVIEYVEEGYSTTETMVVKNDGTYRNNLMFSANYTMTPVRGNFEPLEPRQVRGSGATQVDFLVKPYLRLEDVEIFRNGDIIRASFKLTQTGFDKVKTVGLFVFPEPTVGYQMNTVKVEMAVGERFKHPQQFNINLNIPANSANLKTGKSYFFRVGAIVDVPEAKFNYAPAIRITI